MLLIDDLLTGPFKGLFWIFREIHQAAEQEQAAEADRLTARLSELYMLLETGQVTEEEFAVHEKRLLDRLDQIQERKTRRQANEKKKPRRKPSAQKAKTRARPLRGEARRDYAPASP